MDEEKYLLDLLKARDLMNEVTILRTEMPPIYAKQIKAVFVVQVNAMTEAQIQIPTQEIRKEDYQNGDAISCEKPKNNVDTIRKDCKELRKALGFIR